MQTIQQRLAKQAHADILTVNDDEKKKYGTMAHKLPILIRTAGLTQALAFVQARGSEAQNKLLDHIANAIEIEGIQNGNNLAQKSREESLEQYIFLSRRVMMALVWYKRFVESVLKVSQRDAANEDEQSAALVDAISS